MTKRVFISHSSEDRAFVDDLCRRLKRQGIEIWYSKWEIRVGDSIVTKINSAIEEMGGLIVVLSHSSIRSRWVEEELNAGFMRHLAERDIGLFPVLIDRCEVPPLLAHRRYADFSTDPSTAISQLVEAIFPSQVVMARIEELKTEYREQVTCLLVLSMDDPWWLPSFMEVHTLLEKAVASRYSLEIRHDHNAIAMDRDFFFEQFDYLVHRGYKLQSPDWEWLVGLRNTLCHSAGEYSGRHLLRSFGRGREQDVNEILGRLEKTFDILLEDRRR